jgi:hypothetical protein
MNRALVACGCLVFLTACQAGSSTAQQPTPSAVSAVSPSASQSRLDVACRLPVSIQGVPKDGWTGGFITFPAGSYQADSSGVIQPVGDGDVGTQAQPYLTGHAGGTPFYDLAQQRWLPVGPGLTSPDGSSYAYVVPGLPATEYAVLVFTVATGAHRFWKIALPQPGAGVGWQAEDYDGRYVYVVATQVDQAPEGVWRFDTGTGAVDQLLPTTAGRVLLVRGGVAWVGLNNPADQSPPRAPKGAAFDTIDSINLATGAHTTWIYREGHSAIFWGLDSSSHPVVMVTSPPDFASTLPLVLIDTPGGNGIAIPAGFLPLGAMEADNGRLWFGGPQGIYYWTLASGFIKVYDFAPDPTLQEMMVPAGHCV